MSTFIHLVCDYAQGDMAWAEIVAVLSSKLHDDTRIHCTSVLPFDTISTGFVLAQLALAPQDFRPKNLLLFANTAPRKADNTVESKNANEGLLFAKLRNGVQVLAVNSGYSLAFLKNDIQELWTTNVEKISTSSQFRSRDYFPIAISKASRGDFSFTGQKLTAAQSIIEAPTEIVGYIDCFGNIKTTFTIQDEKLKAMASGSRLNISIGEESRSVTLITDGNSACNSDLIFSPGSSGHDKRYFEIYKRGGNAAGEFANATAGQRVVITSA